MGREVVTVCRHTAIIYATHLEWDTDAVVDIMAGLPKTIAPYYSLTDPTTIPLYEGPLFYPPQRGYPAEQVDGSVALELSPVPGIHVAGALAQRFQRGGLAEEVPAPELPSVSTVPSAPQTLPKIPEVSWHGPVRGYLAGKAGAVQRVIFQLANFSHMVGTVITDGASSWPGRVVVNVDPWVITFDARLELREILKAGGSNGYAVTHTCMLERRDGRAFALARCREMLNCLTWCLWFCRGAAPGVLVPVGFDSHGDPRWSRWEMPHIDPLPDGHWQWFDGFHGARQLSELLPLFLKLYSNPLWERPLKLAIHSYSDAAVMGTLERNVILAQVGLESLAFAHLVKVTQQLRREQFRAPVSKHIRHFLKDVGIRTTIPRNFYGLRGIRPNTPWDGPAAIAWLRNDIVHAANHRVGARRWKVWYQGWQLAVWYLELAVLAVAGYQGPYRNRLQDDVYVGAVEPVPWAV